MSTINSMNELDMSFLTFVLIYDWVSTHGIDIPGYRSDSPDFSPVTLTLHLSQIVMHVKLIGRLCVQHHNAISGQLAVLLKGKATWFMTSQICKFHEKKCIM